MTPLHALVLDGSGGAASTTEFRAPDDGVLWLHLDMGDPTQQAWLRDHSQLDPLLVDALHAEESRPRSLVHGDGLLMSLRGMNPTVDGEPEDMVSLKMWFEPRRVITTRRERVAAGTEVREALLASNGPADGGELLIDLVDHMLRRIGERVGELEDLTDELEEVVLTANTREPRTQLAELRRQAISIRRYLSPQRETVGRLHAERVSWLADGHRAQLRETGDRVTRFLETLDATRERAAVTSEELTNRLSEQMNHTLYVLSVVTAIFLPLGLLTGLLGINVGGMPGTESPLAFWIVVVLMIAIAVVEWILVRRIRLM